MKKFVLIISFFIVSSASAQDGVGFWTGFRAKKDFSNNLAGGFKYQTRIVESFSYIQTNLAEISLAYNFHPKLKIAVFYRFFNKKKDRYSNYEIRHRFYSDATFETHLRRLDFSNRLRYQNQFKDHDGEVEFDASYIRNKVSLAYPNESKFIPFLSLDLFYQIGGSFDQIRPEAGTDYIINPKNIIALSIFHDVGLNTSQYNAFIISLEYKFRF